MTLTEKQQQHRKWVAGLQIPQEQKDAALLLWDSLLTEIPKLEVPPAWLADENAEDAPNGLYHHWKTGRRVGGAATFLDVEVLVDGTVQWCGWEGPKWVKVPSDGEGNFLPVPVLPLPPETVRVLRTYFTEGS